MVRADKTGSGTSNQWNPAGTKNYKIVLRRRGAYAEGGAWLVRHNCQSLTSIRRSIVRANSEGWAVTSVRLVDSTYRLSGSLVTGSNKLTKPSALANDRVDVAEVMGIFREGCKLIDLDAGKTARESARQSLDRQITKGRTACLADGAMLDVAAQILGGIGVQKTSCAKLTQGSVDIMMFNDRVVVLSEARDAAARVEYQGHHMHRTRGRHRGALHRGVCVRGIGNKGL